MLNIMSGYFPGIHYWGIFNEGPVEINRKIIYYNFFFIIILVKCYNETHEQGCLSFHLYLNENILYFLKSLIERLLFEYMINHRWIKVPFYAGFLTLIVSHEHIPFLSSLLCFNLSSHDLLLLNRNSQMIFFLVLRIQFVKFSCLLNGFLMMGNMS
jgi:hypothetical protein